jgi:hypothetical protein
LRPNGRQLIKASPRQTATILAAVCLAGITAGCSVASPSGYHAATVTAAPSASPYAGLPAEYLPRLAGCLREAGWDAEVDASGDSLTVDSLTVEQRPAFMQAKTACEQEIGAPPPPEPLSEIDIRNRYGYLLQARLCLLALGYTISEPPTFDAFAESWLTGPWSPYNDVADVANQQQWQEANLRCPQR